MTTRIRQFSKIILVVLLVLGLWILLAGRPTGNTFANHSGQGGVQLMIDSFAVYNGVFQEQLSWELKDLVPTVDKLFAFDDIKPGDTGLNMISVHLERNPAFVCLDFSNLVDDENGFTEPESLVDVSPQGELSSAMEFFAWRDDGDQVFEPGEQSLFGTSTQAASSTLRDISYPLADATTAAALSPGETHYVGITWCAGDLSVDVATGDISCDATVMQNEYQTDSFTLDVSLRAVEASSFTDYTCKEPTVDLYLNKQISGEDRGFKLTDFFYRIVGNGVDEVVPHDSFTPLPAGTYSIEEIVPAGFDKVDWRIGWFGQCDTTDAFSTTITILPGDIKKGVLYCEADNQYRPGANPHLAGADSSSPVVVDPEPDPAPEVVPESEVTTDEPIIRSRETSGRLRGQEWLVVEDESSWWQDRLNRSR